MTIPFLSHISRHRKLRLLNMHLQEGDSILEVGVGDGWFSNQLRQGRGQVSTLDIEGPADTVGDINDWSVLGMKAHSFDVVVALEVIEHVDCFAALCSLCKPGGLIFLSSPHPRWDWVMRGLEALHLTQKRTSPHTNLTDFDALPQLAEVKQRPLGIHQVGLFRNRVSESEKSDK